MPQELFESDHLRAWKENDIFKPFFERPFLLKMLYFAAQNLDEHPGTKNQNLVKAASLRSLRRYIWNHWLKGIHPSQMQSRELFLFELVMIHSKISEVDYSSPNWKETRKDLAIAQQKLLTIHQPLIKKIRKIINAPLANESLTKM